MSVEQITKGGKHLLELVNDVLDLAKIESGKIDLTVSDVNSDHLIEECEPLAATLAQKRGLQFSTRKGRGHVIRADHMRLKQVLLNLLSNAVKYNRDGGSVVLASEPVDNAMLRFSVSDTGPGISHDQQAQLFQPFSRLGKEDSEIEGTGIGLIITKRLIEAMDGRIGFDSTPGEGTTFWVEVPISGAAPQTMAQSERRDDNTAPKVKPGVDVVGRVVYIEDNPANISLMETLLGHIPGIELKVAHTAELGIVLIHDVMPDLVLMDINLPGMNGIEALGVLRADPATAGIPVIAISAAAMHADVAKGKAAGFEAYLTKPFNIPEMLATIEGMLKV
ncbi:MAG: response regulator [Alphaproteobacteria bacterium]|nr:response regulator [Alphaproteobacteria bacterium]